MARFRCYIIDDEPLALDVIVRHLARFPNFEVCGRTTDAVEGLEQIKSLQPDLLFLDIEMPEITGLELIASMQKKPEIIITTAYREYAVDGFDLGVLDYLVKPIPFPRFLQAIDKFLEKQLPEPSREIPEKTNSLLIKADRKTVKIDLEEIIYVEGVKDYVRIVLEGRHFLTKSSIGNFADLLPKDQFIRVHKSFIVARNKIAAWSANEVEAGGFEIPVGRTYKEAFLAEMPPLTTDHWQLTTDN
ncbi:MAG TPA: LytTR family DNA-binding domain-containing protein [Flavilitoribacter sp.]|nr:LytTR family DNA-binding domain-containing protein [Flavilitoribacter sp.]HMQ87497.1 LytTR family DNA-binding domain-containing protein [Flavilitoribacter sp.]